jgi:hypothetical protein
VLFHRDGDHQAAMEDWPATNLYQKNIWLKADSDHVRSTWGVARLGCTRHTSTTLALVGVWLQGGLTFQTTVGPRTDVAGYNLYMHTCDSLGSTSWYRQEALGTSQGISHCYNMQTGANYAHLSVESGKTELDHMTGQF